MHVLVKDKVIWKVGPTVWNNNVHAAAPSEFTTHEKWGCCLEESKQQEEKSKGKGTVWLPTSDVFSNLSDQASKHLSLVLRGMLGGDINGHHFGVKGFQKFCPLRKEKKLWCLNVLLDAEKAGRKYRGLDSVIPRFSNIILLYGCRISYCGLEDQVTGRGDVYKPLPTPIF